MFKPVAWLIWRTLSASFSERSARDFSSIDSGCWNSLNDGLRMLGKPWLANRLTQFEMKHQNRKNMKKIAPKIDLERGDKKPDWRSNLWAFFVMLVMLWSWQAAVNQLTVRKIPYSEFRAHLARHEVVDAVVRQNEIFGRIVPQAVLAT